MSNQISTAVLHRRKRKKLPSNGISTILFDTNTAIRNNTSQRVTDPTLGYGYNGTRNSGAWCPAEYNLAEVGRIEDVESYVRQAFEKKAALMFKEGWFFSGKNIQVTSYIKKRFDQIANSSGVPTAKLIRDIGIGLLKKSNSFVIKVRDKKASSGKIRRTSGSPKSILPVAGYFIAPAETMEFKLAGNKIIKWRQYLPEGYTKEFLPEDVIHIYHSRKDGFVFGTPLIIPVVDDIRALRKIEENIELLIYQHLFPLFHWKVGTDARPADITEGGDTEVDILKREIQYMPTEGGIVTSERYEVSAIGAEGRALRAESYLTHFKRRVFSGIGISAMDLGESESSNRSTSETLSQNLIDGIKEYQQIVEIFVYEYIIKELLLESDFKFDPLEDENKVEIKFKEIDIDHQRKIETHHSDMFNKDIINFSEARMAIGKEPIEVPSFDEIDNGEDDRDKYPDWYNLRWVLFDRPKAIIQAMDEAYTSTSKANEAIERNKQLELQAKQSVQPKKTSDYSFDFKIHDLVLTDTFIETKKEISEYIKDKSYVDKNWLGQLIRTSILSATDKLHKTQVQAFRKGYSKYNSTRKDEFIQAMSIYRNSLKNRLEGYIEKLVNDIVKKINKTSFLGKGVDDISNNVSSIFDSFSFRTKFIEDVEIRRAFNFGQVISLRHIGVKVFDIKLNEGACEKCINQLDNLNYDTRTTDLNSMVPFHPGCRCKIVIPKVKVVKDSEDSFIKDIKDVSILGCIKKMERKLKKNKLDLTEEELTAMATSMCGNVISDKTDRFEKCILDIRKDLRKKYSDWSEEKIKTSAFKFYNSKLK